MPLSLKEKVAQMVVVRASGHLFDSQIRYPVWEPPAAKLQYWITDLGVGGVLLVDGSAAELAARTQQLQSWATIPLLIAADIEEGVGQRFAGATWFPPPMAIAALAGDNPAKAETYAEKMGAITAKEAVALGLNWVLAPVVDVNNNPENPVINVRAFGETPATVSNLATAFIRGAQQFPVLTTAKHFPGHGDTAVDSHVDLPVLPHSESRLAEIELPPFVEAIAAGVDSVMSAHLSIPAWDASRPATLSPEILTRRLREKLAFGGLIVTDALVMGAIARRYGIEESAILAVEAGADILLMPLDAEVVVNAVCAAVAAGRISEQRIDESLRRIEEAKAKVFPKKEMPQEVAPHPSYYLCEKLEQPEARDTTAEILRHSLRCGGSLPLGPGEGKLRNLILVDDLLNCRFLDRQTPAIAIPQQFGYQLQIIDSNSPSFETGYLSEDFAATMLQLFIRGNPFRQLSTVIEVAKELLKRLLRNSELCALIVYGSPYTLELFVSDLPSGLPYVFSYGQMSQAQAQALEILFGGLPKKED